MMEMQAALFTSALQLVHRCRDNATGAWFRVVMVGFRYAGPGVTETLYLLAPEDESDLTKPVWVVQEELLGGARFTPEVKDAS